MVWHVIVCGGSAIVHILGQMLDFKPLDCGSIGNKCVCLIVASLKLQSALVKIGF